MWIAQIPLAFALGACGQSGGCTAASAASGITFVYQSVLRHVDTPVVVHACVRTLCDVHPVGVSRPQQLVLVGTSAITDGSRVPVSLTIVDKNKRVLFDGTTIVAPRRIQPNGPGCPPTAWAGQVVARGNNHLQQNDRGESP